MPVPAIFFDLDDTLFDHRHSARAGLAAVAAARNVTSHSLAELEAEYDRLLTEMHPRVLAGTVTPAQARRQRFRSLLRYTGDSIDEAGLDACLRVAMAAYREARRAVPGTHELLAALRPENRLGVISNNFLAEQREKLDVIGLRDAVDVLIVSDDVGFAKPDPRIFEVALTRLGIPAAAGVMIGDAWEADVLGARRAGMRAVWYNPQARPLPQPGLVPELRSFLPVEAALDAIGRCCG